MYIYMPVYVVCSTHMITYRKEVEFSSNKTYLKLSLLPGAVVMLQLFPLTGHLHALEQRPRDVGLAQLPELRQAFSNEAGHVLNKQNPIRRAKVSPSHTMPVSYSYFCRWDRGEGRDEGTSCTAKDAGVHRQATH